MVHILSERLSTYAKLWSENGIKANKKIFGTTGVKIPIGIARDELYYELKDLWYEKAI